MKHISLEKDFEDLLHQLVTRANTSDTDETFLCIIDDEKKLKYWRSYLLRFVSEHRIPITIKVDRNGSIINNHIHIQFITSSDLEDMTSLRKCQFTEIYVDLHPKCLEQYEQQLMQLEHDTH